MKNRVAANFIVFLQLAVFLSAGAHAEASFKQVVGDDSLKQTIRPQTSAIYDAEGDYVYVLTRKGFRGDASSSTELRGKVVSGEGEIRQVVATEFTVDGKYSVEYFFGDKGLVFAYETFEYFDEARPQESWRNFKGLGGWERRSYFDGPVIGYAEVTGAGEVVAGADSDELLASAARMRAVLESRLGESKETE